MSVARRQPNARQQQQQSTANGKKGTTGGTGKKTKVFAESLGMQHLLQMSNDIATEHAGKLNERVERAKGKRAWQKERNVRKNGGGVSDNAERKETSEKQRTQTPSTKTLDTSISAPIETPITKAGIRASIVSKQREKARKRKEARKAAYNASKTDKAENVVVDAQSEHASDSPLPRSSKRVKFA